MHPSQGPKTPLIFLKKKNNPLTTILTNQDYTQKKKGTEIVPLGACP